MSKNVNCLEIKNLCKEYEDFALQNVSFTVPTGSIMGFVGQNGAGKTTTMKAMLNLIEADSGSIKIFGEHHTDVDLKEDISVVFDTVCFSGSLTPRKLEQVMATSYENWDEDLYFEYLDRLGVPLDKQIKAFSRGMTMKVTIAVALSHEARFLILDEATAGLDPVVRDEVLALFQEFVEDENNSILMSSHITSDLEKIADYITFIHKGRVILTENKDVLRDEYGIGRMKKADFEKLDKADYLSSRVNGLQQEVLVRNQEEFSRKYPNILVERATIDEMLAFIITMEGQ
ncbi:MAG: ABC transporter ATP-binding protein [Eubacteriales bacterium]